MLTTIPLTLIPLILANLFGSSWTGNPDEDPWSAPLLNMRMMSGATWSLTAGDAVILLGIVLLFFEILKATRTSNASLTDHILSLFTFVIYLVEFLTVRFAAHSVFFILTALSCVDVIAGFSITIRGARRDVDYNRD